LSQKHLQQVFVPVKDALAESFDRLDELHKTTGGLRGVPTGFKDLDNALAGMQNSNLLILAARPGVGKSTLALNIAQHVTVKHKIPVGIFSLEMSKEELVDRLDPLERNTKRMMNIINHLRTFSRQSTSDFVRVDVNQILEDSFFYDQSGG